MSMRRAHTNTVAELVSAVRTGIPLKAACGYVRLLDAESSFDCDAVVCKSCARITGFGIGGDAIHIPPYAEIEARMPSVFTYTFSYDALRGWIGQ